MNIDKGMEGLGLKHAQSGGLGRLTQWCDVLGTCSGLVRVPHLLRLRFASPFVWQTVLGRKAVRQAVFEDY